jgi:hypothetical protein
MMLTYGTSYAALILLTQTRLGLSCRFMRTTRSRGMETIDTRLLVGSMVTAMMESVRYGASFS